MQKVYPDYYKDFRCIADRCVHNCCIGWEIDIDEHTEAIYKKTNGEMGKRLLSSIDFDSSPPHFIHADNKRCPFLNSHNLCDIITDMGEQHLCDICREHPRFHNELPGAVESGLGMCCEEAARIILTAQAPVKLVYEGVSDESDEIIALRDKVIKILQNKSKSINNRIEDMLTLCGATVPSYSTKQWAEFLFTLERLDENWTTLLTKLTDIYTPDNVKAFDEYMANREHEYEQLLVYIIYRHFAVSPDKEEAALKASFAAVCYRLIHALGAVIFCEEGKFTVSQQIELCRMLSSEIEYSDENLDKILDEIYYNSTRYTIIINRS